MNARDEDRAKASRAQCRKDYYLAVNDDILPVVGDQDQDQDRPTISNSSNDKNIRRASSCAAVPLCSSASSAVRTGSEF
jgi:hypothetical protein